MYRMPVAPSSCWPGSLLSAMPFPRDFALRLERPLGVFENRRQQRQRGTRDTASTTGALSSFRFLLSPLLDTSELPFRLRHPDYDERIPEWGERD